MALAALDTTKERATCMAVNILLREITVDDGLPIACGKRGNLFDETPLTLPAHDLDPLTYRLD